MASQKEQVEATEAKADVADDEAEFSGAWDELDAEESGQPSEAEGRQDDEDDESSEGGDEAGQVASESDTPDADADTASRDETPDDIWADAPEPLRKAYEASEEARKKAENLVRSNGARAARAQSELYALQQKLQAERKEDAATEEGAEATDPEERYRQLREEYPEVAGPLLDRIVKLESVVNSVAADREAEAEAKGAEFFDRQRTELIEQHSDFDQIVSDPDYAEWLSAQVPAIQRVIAENAQAIVNAAECAWVLDLYKRDRGHSSEAATRVADKRRKQLEAGTAAHTRTPAVTRDTSDSYESEWDRLEREEAQRSARRR